VAAQLFGDRLDFSSRHTLHVHLGERGSECLLRTLVVCEQLGREVAMAILRHAQLQLAHPGEQGARVVAGPVAEPLRRPLALPGAQCLGHLGFQELLQDRLHQCRGKSWSSLSSAFTSSSVRLSLPWGMVCILR
jgi:hypothetical protein